jgi:hypothetical protein
MDAAAFVLKLILPLYRTRHPHLLAPKLLEYTISDIKVNAEADVIERIISMFKPLSLPISLSSHKCTNTHCIWHCSLELDICPTSNMIPYLRLLRTLVRMLKVIATRERVRPLRRKIDSCAHWVQHIITGLTQTIKWGEIQRSTLSFHRHRSTSM